MFSGIIETTIRAEEIEKQGDSSRIYFKAPQKWHIQEGESISIDGICSTVESINDGIFSVYYMPETLNVTTVGEFSNSHLFNLERSLTLQSLIGGHLVSGHIDTTAKLVSIEKEQDVSKETANGRTKILKFKLDKKYTKYIIQKGSVAVNGVSLTIVSVGRDFFTISLIPYTLIHTNLGTLEEEDRVNIELDLIAKYLEKFQRYR